METIFFTASQSVDENMGVNKHTARSTKLFVQLFVMLVSYSKSGFESH